MAIFGFAASPTKIARHGNSPRMKHQHAKSQRKTELQLPLALHCAANTTCRTPVVARLKVLWCSGSQSHSLWFLLAGRPFCITVQYPVLLPVPGLRLRPMRCSLKAPKKNTWPHEGCASASARMQLDEGNRPQPVCYCMSLYVQFFLLSPLRPRYCRSSLWLSLWV